MKHPIEITKYNGTLDELVEDIGNLRYDVLHDFIDKLSIKILKDATKDEKKGRKLLSKELFHASSLLFLIKHPLNKAWNICKKFIKGK